MTKRRPLWGLVPTGANDDGPDHDRSLRSLLAAVRRRTLVPVVAARRVSGPDDVADLLTRGATLVQAGTVLLRCLESGAHPRYKEVLADPAPADVLGATTITRAFSGRRARSLVNAMARDHPGAPAAYPEINNATRPLRAAAAQAGDAGHMSLYAGTGFYAAPSRPAARHRGVARVGGALLSRRRETMTIEFRPPDVAGVADSLAKLRDAGSGWINLLPGIHEDAADPEPAAGLFAFFGNRAAPVSMATVMPAKKERRDTEGVTIGVMHPTGAKAIARLAEAGVTLPEGWVVRQDHCAGVCWCARRPTRPTLTCSPGASAPRTRYAAPT